MNKVEALLDVAKKVTGDRALKHGDSNVQLAHATRLKRTLGHHEIALASKDEYINDVEVECLDSICTKLSRIVCGAYNEDDWLDIIGYSVCALASRHKFTSETAQDTMDTDALEQLQKIAAKFAPRVVSDKDSTGR